MRAWTADIRGRQSRLGYLLALVALCLQLAAPMLPAPQVSAQVPDYERVRRELPESPGATP